MVYLEKSQPAPSSLEEEKKKASGDYKTVEVLNRLKADFKSKCYICEFKPTSYNVEHFTPHKGNKDLMFDWNNLFLSCSHCNNTKGAQKKYDNLLNCTNKTHDVENRLKYIFKPFPQALVQIEALDTLPETQATKELLLEVYNGATPLKVILNSSTLREWLFKEIEEFQSLLCEYFKDNPEKEKQNLLIKIQAHINRASNFTAFKRWIVKENPRLREKFEQYFD